MRHNPSSQSKLIRIKKAAEFLGVSVDTIRRWEKKGEIQSVRSNGGHRLFHLSDLEHYRDYRPLTISETAKELGISNSQLRIIEQQGQILPAQLSQV